MPKGAGTDPDRLIRQHAGTYRTEDGRFEVRESDTGWFVVDSSETNEFGQPLMHGPFGTLKVARDALPGARKAKRLRRGIATARTSGKSSRPKATPEPAPSPRSWIEELPPSKAREVRGLVRALEAEGVAEAEALVRRDRDGLLPAVATDLIERRLDALVEELPAAGRKPARDLIRRAAEVLTSDGMAVRPPLSRWTLIELGPGDDEPQNRRIVIRR